MNRLDARARLVFHYAREEADRLGHTVIESEHLLLGLLREGGLASQVLLQSGLTLEAARQRVVEIVGRFERSRDAPPPTITSAARRVMDLAGVEASAYQSTVITTGHVLLGMIQAHDGIAMMLLNQLGGGAKLVRKATLEALQLPADVEKESVSAGSNLSGIVAVPADSVLARLLGGSQPETRAIPKMPPAGMDSSPVVTEIASKTVVVPESEPVAADLEPMASSASEALVETNTTAEAVVEVMVDDKLDVVSDSMEAIEETEIPDSIEETKIPDSIEETKIPDSIEETEIPDSILMDVKFEEVIEAPLFSMQSSSAMDNEIMMELEQSRGMPLPEVNLDDEFESVIMPVDALADESESDALGIPVLESEQALLSEMAVSELRSVVPQEEPLVESNKQAAMALAATLRSKAEQESLRQAQIVIPDPFPRTLSEFEQQVSAEEFRKAKSTLELDTPAAIPEPLPPELAPHASVPEDDIEVLIETDTDGDASNEIKAITAMPLTPEAVAPEEVVSLAPESLSQPEVLNTRSSSDDLESDSWDSAGSTPAQVVEMGIPALDLSDVAEPAFIVPKVELEDFETRPVYISQTEMTVDAPMVQKLTVTSTPMAANLAASSELDTSNLDEEFTNMPEFPESPDISKMALMAVPDSEVGIRQPEADLELNADESDFEMHLPHDQLEDAIPLEVLMPTEAQTANHLLSTETNHVPETEIPVIEQPEEPDFPELELVSHPSSWDMVTASSMMKRQIIAFGGGGFSQEPDNLLLDHYVLETARMAREVSRPRVCFIPTAAGDSPQYIERFYTAFKPLECEPMHLPLFHTEDWTDELEDTILSADVLYFSGGSTKNALALWKAWELEPIFQKAYEGGTVFAGLSAGAICWFEQFTTDSAGRSLGVMEGLGWLPGSFTPHYDAERYRRFALEKFLRAHKIAPGFAADDGAALHFVNGEYKAAISSRASAKAYHVTLGRNRLVESPLETRFLGESSDE